MEAVAETSEEFMERYFDGEEFSVEEIRCCNAYGSDGRRHRSCRYGIERTGAGRCESAF